MFKHPQLISGKIGQRTLCKTGLFIQIVHDPFAKTRRFSSPSRSFQAYNSPNTHDQYSTIQQLAETFKQNFYEHLLS